MTSTLQGMDPDRRAAVRAMLVDEVRGVGAPVALRSRRPVLALASVAGFAAAALVVATAWVVARPTPAYAVSGGNGEEVTVTVSRLEGAAALEAALDERGIRADVTYLPDGQACQPGRHDDTGADLSLSVGPDFFEVRIPPGAVGDGETFVLSAAATSLDDGTGVSAIVDFAIARGPVPACVPVAAD
ncbi:hypothetical protein GCM10028777_13160 [Angustibacter speluncae]